MERRRIDNKIDNSSYLINKGNNFYIENFCKKFHFMKN